MPTQQAVRPAAIALGLYFAWCAHFVGLLVWLNIDHDSAYAWTVALGIETHCHCFGGSGFFSHLPEVEGAALVSGGALGAVGILYGGVALARVRTARALAVAALALVANLSILEPVAFALWDANQRESEVRPSRPRGLTPWDQARRARYG